MYRCCGAGIYKKKLGELKPFIDANIVWDKVFIVKISENQHSFIWKRVELILETQQTTPILQCCVSMG